MFAPWRSHNPVRITKSPITGKSFIAVVQIIAEDFILEMELKFVQYWEHQNKQWTGKLW